MPTFSGSQIALLVCNHTQPMVTRRLTCWIASFRPSFRETCEERHGLSPVAGILRVAAERLRKRDELHGHFPNFGEIKGTVEIGVVQREYFALLVRFPSSDDMPFSLTLGVSDPPGA